MINVSPKTTIVIDDEHDNAAVFAEYLSLYNFDVLATGHDGKSAFELYQKLRPEVVFLDLMMPEYDGFYGLEKIKRFDPSAKVIIVTADASEAATRRIALLGAGAVVYKPVKMNEILLAVKKLEEVATR